jgi:selenocysteine lyase/cysteine desulfurase
MHGANWTGEDTYQAIDTAKRFENWEFAWAQVLGTGAAAEYANDIGLGDIQQRVHALVRQLRDGLASIGKVHVLGGDAELAGIVTATIRDQDPAEIVTSFRAEGINVSSQGREYAVMDYDSKNVASALRISPHYYNTEDEISQVIEAIDRL